MLLQLFALISIGLVGNVGVVGDPLHQHDGSHRELVQVDVGLRAPLVASSKVWHKFNGSKGRLKTLLVPLELVITVADVAMGHNFNDDHIKK